MTTVSAEIQFSLSGPMIPEAELSSLTPDDVGPFDETIGGIALSGEGAELLIGDELGYLVSSLCAVVLPALTSEGSADFVGVEADEVFTFSRVGDVIEITSDLGEAASFPAGPMLEAVVGAAERLMELAPSLWPDDPDGSLVACRDEVAAARAAIS